MKLRLAATAMILLASAPLTAHADVFSFNFTPLPSFSAPDDALSFSLDNSLPPASFTDSANGSVFYYTNVSVSSNGFTYMREVGFGDFSGDSILYELGVGQSVVVNRGAIYIGSDSPSAGFFNNNAFFSGRSSAPVFLPGIYTRPTDGILTITDQTTSVTPEPSTFALLGTGLLGIAGLLRRRVAQA